MATTQEYIVRKAPITQKVFNVMRFMSGGNVDVRRWKTSGEKVKLEREGGSRPDRQSEVDNEPRFGAGSEFGRIERKEAREARFRPRKIREQPWTLTVKASSRSLEECRSNAELKTSDVKKFSGKKDGGVMDNSSYYVFFQAEDGAFEAFPVNEWINFTPVQRFKALTAEQAEEQFEKRDKIMNFFPLMKGVKREEEGTNDGTISNQVKKERRSFKVSELDEWGGINDSDLDSSENEDGGKGGKKKRGRKKKGSDEERSEAGEDSDEGDFDQREFDYMSESSESDSEPEDVRVNKELKSVADEEGLRKIAASDEEDSDEEEKNGANGKDIDRMDIDGNPIKDKKIKKESVDGEISESSAEDSDDSDIDESKPWNQIQSRSSKSSVKSGSSEQGSAPTSRAQTPVKEVPESSRNVVESSRNVSESNKNVPESNKNVSESNKNVQGLKRKLADSTPASPAPSSSSASNPATPTSSQPSAGSSSGQPSAGSGQPAAKKLRSTDSEGLSEEAVRRYLTRRPMTVRDLIKKFKKCWSGSKQDLMNSIVNILKKINPDKQTIRGELHLSLKAPKQ